MPAYDYRCTDCSNVFEVNRQMGSTADEACPSCGGHAKRVFTPVGVAFKGSGFHNTDYRPAPKDSSDSPAPACPSGGGCAGCPAAE